MKRAVLSALSVALAAVAASAAAARAPSPWTAATFPNPNTDTNACGRRGVRSWVCDPDGVISFESANVVEGLLQKIAEGTQPYRKDVCGDRFEGYQVGVALMQEMAVPAGQSAAEAAEAFAKRLHDAWGVGSAACHNGVLLLLAINNRQIYISTGAAADKRAPADVLDAVIAHVRTFLKQARYDQAVETAVVDIGLALAGQAVPGGGGGKQGGGIDWILVSFMTLGAGAFAYGIVKSRRERQRYRGALTKLEKLKRDQQAAARNDYRATSCPICLEDFDEVGGGGSGSSAAAAAAADDVVADSGPSAPLLPGGGGAQAKTGSSAPLETNLKGAGAGSSRAAGSSSSSSMPAPHTPRRPLGLPCGHAFCEPCITEWAQTKTNCPICRKPIDEDAQGAAPDDMRPPCSAAAAASTSSSSGRGPATAYTSGGGVLLGRQRFTYRPQRRNLADDVVRAELLYRLTSLQRRYPDYVHQSMVDAWMNDVQAGRPLDADAWRRFQLADPAVREQLQRAGSRGTGVSFGGGSSSGGGGRGGSW